MKKIFLASILLFCLTIFAQTGPPATFNGNVFFKYLPPSNTNTTAITIDPSTKQAMSTDIVTGVKGSGETIFRTGQVNITAANIGIGLANASTAGIAKLFNSTGINTDGSMTQLAITNALTNAGINYVKKTGETNQDIEGGIVLKSFTPSINTTLNGSSVVITNTNLNTSTLTASYFQFTDIVTGGSVRLKPNTTIPSFYNLTLPNKSGTISTEEYADAKISQTINDGVIISAPSEDAVFDALATKQPTLVSGTNIKTIEGQSLVGASNIDLNKSDVGLSNVDNTNDLSKPISTATQAALNTKINTSIIGQPNGLATLDNGGKVLLSQLPNSILVLRGEWNASTNTPTLINGTGTPGYFYKVTTPGTQNLGSGNITFNIGDYVVYGDNGLWFKSINSNNVDSVAGKTGIVVLNKADVGLSNIDNTSDLNKPVSTATQNGLNLKANLSGGNAFHGSQSVNGNIGFAGDWALNFNGVFGMQYNSTYGGLNILKLGEYDGALFVKNNGNVGIGTTDPQAKLDINGDVNVSQSLIIKNKLNLKGSTVDNWEFSVNESGALSLKNIYQTASSYLSVDPITGELAVINGTQSNSAVNKSQLNTGLATKPTLGGDSLGVPITIGTNDAQDFNLEYNNTGKIKINSIVRVQALAAFDNQIYMTATNAIRTATGDGGSIIIGDTNNSMKFTHTATGGSTALTGFDFLGSINIPDITRWRVGGIIAGVRNDARVYGSDAVASNDLVPLGQMNTALALKPTIGYTAPSSATDTGVKGEIRITSTYVYYCINTNTWVRTVAATW